MPAYHRQASQNHLILIPLQELYTKWFLSGNRKMLPIGNPELKRSVS
jgi:hypothetical protein